MGPGISLLHTNRSSGRVAPTAPEKTCRLWRPQGAPRFRSRKTWIYVVDLPIDLDSSLRVKGLPIARGQHVRKVLRGIQYTQDNGGAGFLFRNRDLLIGSGGLGSVNKLSSDAG